MTTFYFPGTAAFLLRECTYLGEIAIENALHNYGARGEQWWIKSRRPGNHHYHFVPVPGGWRVTDGPLHNPRRLANVEPPF